MGRSARAWKNSLTFVGNPGLLVPHLKKRTLLDLPLSLGPSLPTKPRIRALVLDKDNTICPPNTTLIHPEYREAINVLKTSPQLSHHADSIIIVSNSAGSTQSSKHEREAQYLESQLRLPVLRQWKLRPGLTKPRIGPYVAQYLLDRGVVSSSREIAVIGDRMLTDVEMARSMCSWSILLEDGWRDPEDPTKSYHDIWTRLERKWWSLMKGLLWTEDDVPLLPEEQPEEKSFEEVLEAMHSRYTAYLETRARNESQQRRQKRDQSMKQSRERFVDDLEEKIRDEEDPKKKASLQRMKEGMKARSPKHTDKEK